ncbi:MAG: pur operon repressor [Bacillota bacterium]
MKMKRSERIVAITKILTDKPYKLFSLNHFTAEFEAAKSTISEDLTIIKRVFAAKEMGEVETISGAGGGVRFIPKKAASDIEAVISSICKRLSDSDRILPGGFLYLSDLIFSPQIKELGKIFATKFAELDVDYVITIETKGIPLALATAQAMNLPVVSIRKDNRVTEGSVVSINYVTGSSKKIETMSLSRRALPENSKVVIIDDFMKAGGTAKGMVDLLAEFKAEVLDIGVLVETAEPQQKLVSDYISLITLEQVDEKQEIVQLRPSDWLIT